KKVNEIIKGLAPNSGLVMLFNDNYLWQCDVFKNPPIQPQDKYNLLVTSGAVQDVMLTDIYPQEEVWSNGDGALPPNVNWPPEAGYGRLQHALNNEDYDYKLNHVYDYG